MAKYAQRSGAGDRRDAGVMHGGCGALTRGRGRTNVTFVKLAPVALGLCLMVFGCGSGASSVALTDPSSGAMAYEDQDISFAHPSSWTATPYKDQSSFTRTLVDLSNLPMHAPCTTNTTVDGTQTACGWPVNRLSKDGVLIVWEADGFPGWSLQTTPGISMKIGGLAARRNVARPGDCAGIGATETITVSIQRAAADNYFRMRACLAGPDRASAEDQVGAMLQSVSFPRG
jgi:hypothetical protein